MVDVNEDTQKALHSICVYICMELGFFGMCVCEGECSMFVRSCTRVHIEIAIKRPSEME